MDKFIPNKYEFSAISPAASTGSFKSTNSITGSPKKVKVPNPHGSSTSDIPEPKSVDENQVISFPLPPKQYISCFSNENVKKGTTPSPPPLPVGNQLYKVFGETTYNDNENILMSLESQGFRRLYSKRYDSKQELKKMNFSLLANFLDLMKIIHECPGSPQREEKHYDITLLFIHMHHLINEFRVHQAREALRRMLEVQTIENNYISRKIEKHLLLIERKMYLTLKIKGIKTKKDVPTGNEPSCAVVKPSLMLDSSSETNRLILGIKDKIMCDICDMEIE